MKKFITLLIILAFTINTNAQNNEPSKATLVTKMTSMKHISSIASRPQDQILVELSEVSEAQDARSKNQPEIIIGKDPQRTNDYFTLNPNALEQKLQGKTPSLVFDAASSNSQPTDPSLAVGPNHVLVVFNTGFRIFAKDGTPLTGQIAPNPAIFASSGCCDLTVSYDNAADRWVLSFLNGAGAGIQVAVSDGPDPVNDGWYLYSANSVNDYNKLSVWRDGYYVTDNTSGSTKVYALERDKMLVGDPSAQVIGFPLPGMATFGFHSPQALNISDDNYPTSGGATFVYMQDDAWGGVSQDHIKLWTLNMDWANSNGTMSAAQTINTTPFIGVFDGGSFSNLAQPNGGSTIDALQATIMNQAQFRKFGSHNSALFNFVVDTDASSGKLAGIRWVELRQANDTAPWTLFQEGTYTAADGKHAWNASLIMDAFGNIGMGYTGMGGSGNKNAGMYYTGRFAGDPAGTMTVSEEIILEGNGNIPGTRYGDYSKIDIDPADDRTFWFIDEMMNSGRKDVVGVFTLELLNSDTGVTSIDSPVDGNTSATQNVTVTISNFGATSQSNIPVSYTFNGNTVNETYTGTIASGSSAQHTFATTVDMSTGEVYNIESCTNLAGDESAANDCSSVILNQLPVCIPVAGDGDTGTDTNGCNLDGIKHFVLGTINVDDGGNGCNNEGGGIVKGYADRRHLSTDLNLQIGTYILQSQMNWDGGVNGPEKLSVWIDFNDNGTFEGSEQLISGEEYTAFEELVDFNLVLPSNANLGSHILRARSIDTSSSPGDVNDPCADYDFGETQDYTVNIIDQVISVDDNLFDEANFIVSSLPNNQFNISVLTTDITERLNFTVTNMIGQKLLSYNIDNTNGGYSYDLDMSYATPGVYILRLGNSKLGNTKKIIVQ